MDVRVICDAFGSAGAGGEVSRRMRAAGVRLREFHPWKPSRLRHGWHPHQRDHRKLLVVDEDVGGLGGQYVGDEYGRWLPAAPDVPTWRDTAVGIRGPAVRLLVDAFERVWQYVGRGGPLRGAELFHGPQTGRAWAGIARRPPTIRHVEPARPVGSCLHAPDTSIALLAAVPSA